MPFRIPYLQKFPVKVVIFEKRGDRGSVLIKFDSARYVKERDQFYYELKKSGHKAKPVDFENYAVGSGGKSIAFLYEYNRGEFVPIDINNLEEAHDENGNPLAIHLKATPGDVTFWGQQRRIAAEARHADESWFAKNKELIMFMAFGVFLIIFAYIFMTNISTASNQAVDRLVSVLQSVGLNVKPPG